MKHLIVILFILSPFISTAQFGTISGTVKDKSVLTPIVDARIVIDKNNIEAKSDSNGNYFIENIPTGSVNIVIIKNGYKSEEIFNTIITSGTIQTFNVELEKKNSKLTDVVVKGAKKQTVIASDIITPLSVQRLTATEIKSNPGGNFDISKVVQALPGVAGNTAGGSFRNDIIIRGGGPNENVFYIDGIEIPVLNHFQTQGASGGPAGILNVSFIEDVKLSSSAFDAKFDNALASVFQFKQINGNTRKIKGNVRLSASELAATIEGPLSSKTTFLLSARRSYLQLLFKLIGIPIRPNYWDFQTKLNYKIDNKSTLTFVGVGAIDEFTTESNANSSAENEYILRRVPYINQWNYTNGLTYKRLINQGYYIISLSRNMFDNKIDIFENKQQGNEDFRALKNNSQEIENKLRFEYNKVINDWRVSFGASAQFVKFNNEVKVKLVNELRDTSGNIIVPKLFVDYKTDINFMKYGVFAQASKKFLNDKLGASFGLRSDMNSFMTNGMNPLNTLSPRVALSYAIAPKWQISTSVGSYYKIPIYTSLGFKDNMGAFVNKNTKYIQSNHYVLGVEYLPKNDLRITLEGFYKQYNNYMVSKANGISLANMGTDFLAIGNEAISSDGKGRAYGMELFVQKKLSKNLFSTASYTLVRSEFSGTNQQLVASAWDNIHLFSGIFGYKFKRNWELGLKYRFTAGSPYTPFDTVASSRSFVINGAGTFNYNQLNTLRLPNFNQLDIRIDKRYNYKKTSLDLFIDITNLLGFENVSIPNFVFKRNATNTDFETSDGKALAPDGSNGIPVVTPNTSNLRTPTIGFIFEF